MILHLQVSKIFSAIATSYLAQYPSLLQFRCPVNRQYEQISESGQKLPSLAIQDVQNWRFVGMYENVPNQFMISGKLGNSYCGGRLHGGDSRSIICSKFRN